MSKFRGKFTEAQIDTMIDSLITMAEDQMEYLGQENGPRFRALTKAAIEKMRDKFKADK